METRHIRHSPTSIARHDPDRAYTAIQRISMLRVATVRIGYYATLLYRPNPNGAEPADVRANWRDILTQSVAAFSEISAVLENGAPLEGFDAGISDWIHSYALRYPAEARDIIQVCALSQLIAANALDTGPEQDARLMEHMNVARGRFYPAVIHICEAMQTDLHDARIAGLKQAAASATILAQRLSRLEHIGKHVRIVSLNASVEAARVGDAGRGLSVIAHEFKVLAEEITAIARDARNDVVENPPR